MNCKPGDLAVVVRAEKMPENLGRLVIVERAADEQEFVRNHAGHIWIVRTAAGSPMSAMFSSGRVGQVISRPYSDSALRPIRPNEGEDESLSWAIRSDQREFVQQK